MNTSNVSKVAMRHMLVEMLKCGAGETAYHADNLEVMHALVNQLHKDKWLSKSDLKEVRQAIKDAYRFYHPGVSGSEYDYLFDDIINK